MASTKDETMKEATLSVLNKYTPQNPGNPGTVAGEILQECENLIGIENSVRQAGHKWRTPERLVPFQIAEVLLRVYYVAMINVANGGGDGGDDEGYSLIGLYQTTGKNLGTYETSETELRKTARLYCPSMTKREFDEVMTILKESAVRVKPCREPHLLPVNNGIFDYDTKQLLEFSPDYVFLSKSQVDYNLNATNVVIHNPIDNTDWDVESWMNELSDDPEVVNVLWQVLGAIIRPNVPWNKSVWFYSESGNNGKGTFCELMRQLVGHGNYASISLADFGKDFMLEPLIHAQAVITDENDVGTYVDKAANLKAVVTGDAININRKFKVPLTYCFHGLVVQCLNEMPRIRDKSDSFYRRQLFIAFTKCFTGKERKYIKQDYLHRREVLEYVLYKVLNMNYYSFDVPGACENVLEEYKEFNDPVRQFMNEIMPQLKWDLVPFSFLYDLYGAWYKKNFPGRGEMKSSTVFIKDVLSLLPMYPEWVCDDKRKVRRPGQKMDAAELLIAEYNLTDWMDPKYTASKDIEKRCHPLLKTGYNGIVRVGISASSTTEEQ